MNILFLVGVLSASPAWADDFDIEPTTNEVAHAGPVEITGYTAVGIGIASVLASAVPMQSAVNRQDRLKEPDLYFSTQTEFEAERDRYARDRAIGNALLFGGIATYVLGATCVYVDIATRPDEVTTVGMRGRF